MPDVTDIGDPEVFELPTDEQPKNGEWIDVHDVIIEGRDDEQGDR